MNLEGLVKNLAKRLDRFDSVIPSNNKTSLSHWKGKPIIPLDEWIELRDTSYALRYFPDDFDKDLTYILEGELNGERKQQDMKKWNSDFLELIKRTKNPNYGRLKCFHCLLSPDGNDPIFIGINRLVAKGLNNDKQENSPIEYPCQIVNRFQCPYEQANIREDDNVESTNSHFNVEDLFRLQRMAFVVEIALAKARKDDSEIQIKDKQALLYALTDKDGFTKILEQAVDILKSTEYREISAGQDTNGIVDYFMRIKNCVDLNELGFS